MSTKVRKIGNSAGVILPKPVLAALGVSEGGAVEFVYEAGKVTIVPAKRKVREGWAEDFEALAKEGLSEEDRDWLEADLTSGTDDEALGPDWTDEEIAALEAALAKNEPKKL